MAIEAAQQTNPQPYDGPHSAPPEPNPDGEVSHTLRAKSAVSGGVPHRPRTTGSGVVDAPGQARLARLHAKQVLLRLQSTRAYLAKGTHR